MLLEIALGLSALSVGAFPLAYWMSPQARVRRRVSSQLGKVRKARERLRTPIERAEGELERQARDYSTGIQRKKLFQTPIEDLKKAGVSRIRWASLRDGGIRTLGDLEGRSIQQLMALPGVGGETARAIHQGGRGVIAQVLGAPAPPPAPDSWNEPATRKLALAAWQVLQLRDQLLLPAEHLEYVLQDLEPLGGKVAGLTRFRDWVRPGRRASRHAEATAYAQQIATRVDALRGAGHLSITPPPRGKIAAPLERVQADFEVRHADFVAVIERALDQDQGLGVDGRLPMTGPRRGIPAAVARLVEAHPLDTTGMKSVLRRYQEFGARFLLAQNRTVLGDEMGLGKTIQALAAMTHLRNQHAGTHFLVVCPAGILHNWAHETARRASLPVRMFHGPERDSIVRKWLVDGGLGLTSYTTLRGLDLPQKLANSSRSIHMLVADEAHYIKNPRASRTQAVRALLGRTRHVSLLSGTPLENRVSEFRNLIELVSPDIAQQVPRQVLGFETVAPLVAKAYLRRNQSDVLGELPDRIEFEEWVDLSSTDLDAYREAVFSRDYMGMRQAVTLGRHHQQSSKLARLNELLENYAVEGRKVLVFSYFLAVLDRLAQEFQTVGCLQGCVTPEHRRRLVESFQATPGPAVLLAQITAGGVGINLQAASVVILMEPQFKPSTENQAIARAHRMGQTRQVHVHRMLARDTLEERMLEVLQAKQELFDRNVRESELKRASSAATDTTVAPSEAAFQEEIIAREMERLSAG